MADLDRKFGIVPHYARYLTDRTGDLSSREVENLRALLRLFERKFPQLLFSVHVVNVGPRGSLGEYAFWLINRARFSTLNAIGPRNFELLLVVDPSAAAAALIVGYALEQYLSEDDLHDALMAGSASFGAGKFALGIQQCVDFVIQRFREIVLQFEEKKISLDPAMDTQ
jgi:uncharacterized membrane protein YgcG